jgi:hypothetical protein
VGESAIYHLTILDWTANKSAFIFIVRTHTNLRIMDILDRVRAGNMTFFAGTRSDLREISESLDKAGIPYKIHG